MSGDFGKVRFLSFVLVLVAYFQCGVGELLIPNLEIMYEEEKQHASSLAMLQAVAQFTARGYAPSSIPKRDLSLPSLREALQQAQRKEETK
jgi:hypothetical protein